MFAQYTITKSTIDEIKSSRGEFYNKIMTLGNNVKEEQYKNFEEILHKINLPDPQSGDILDMSELEDKWFPCPNNNPRVFISHSHLNEEYVLFIAGFLKSSSIECFVDSWCWGYMDKLQFALDKKYCKLTEFTFSYEKVMFTTSLVKSLLISALSKVMDKAECAIFLKTKESTLSIDGYGPGTGSPWLYIENMTLGLLRPKIPHYLKEKMEIITYHSKRVGDSISEDSKIITYFPLVNTFPEIGKNSIIYLSYGNDPKEALITLYASIPRGWKKYFPNHNLPGCHWNTHILYDN